MDVAFCGFQIKRDKGGGGGGGARSFISLDLRNIYTYIWDYYFSRLHVSAAPYQQHETQYRNYLHKVLVTSNMNVIYVYMNPTLLAL